MDRAHHLAVAFEEIQRYQLTAWKMAQQTESGNHSDGALVKDTAKRDHWTLRRIMQQGFKNHTEKTLAYIAKGGPR